MCGIIGYVGRRPCKDLLLSGLERLEYRGYDSAGIALLTDGALEYTRAVGPLSIVLNGIVENFRELKEGLQAEGHVFTSETDAETVSHLVERHYDGDLVE